MAKQYWPERVELFPELPRTASGKIQKFQLRALMERHNGTGPQPVP
ncbi:hypothetical protein [Amycolatopsis silviterrae]|uniref:AMP-binding enzyme C-terminal domain-containing protein n=1 Tax=Amycolatopsis silviterrae TaxID=1656914 RepID=A0ABW5H7N2_9PSEU